MKSWPRLRVLAAVFAITAPMGAEQPKFETASVKRTDRCGMQNSLNPGRVTLNGVPLIGVLMEAFQVKKDQIAGPSWLDADCFDIMAKMPEGATKEQLPAMLQALLAERFKLAAHKESRLRPGYVLVVDKNGPKLKAHDPNDAAARGRAGMVRFGIGPEAGIKGAMTVAGLAGFLSRRLDGPVQDLTGIEGTYAVDLSWAPDPAFEKPSNFPQSGAAEASLPAGKASLFTSLQETLGLKLESRKQQVEVVVIDSIERVPTDN